MAVFAIAVLLLFACAPSGEKVAVLIPPGLSTRAIADTLAARGIITSPQRFRVLARLLGFDRRLRQGMYDFAPGTNELSVLTALTRPGRGSVRVTIPEGFTMRRIAELLEESNVCCAEGFLASCRDRQLLDSLGVPFPSAEGCLFPETYDFEYNSAPAAVVGRMVRQFFFVYNPLKDEHPAALDDRSTIILASIVEREAVRREEAATIAGVFLNRLRKGMPLQSCATVEYILPVHKAKLTYEDIRTPSPYNTYLHPGLPPGPISNPGRAGLDAALRPEKTDHLYFLSAGDGSHVFSRTLSEHQSAQRRVRRGGAARN